MVDIDKLIDVNKEKKKIKTNTFKQILQMFYNKIENVSLFDVGKIALATITSYEPLAWLLLWLGSYLGIDKGVWISILNLFLITGVYFLCIKNKARWWIIGLLLTNFYLLVLMTSAERLKISYILLVWSFVFEGRLRFFLLLLTPLAHMQSIILLSSLMAVYMSDEIKRFFLFFKLSKIKMLQFFILISLFLFIFIYIGDGLLHKASKYVDVDFELNNFFQIALLMIVVFAATRDKFRMILALFPVLFSIALVGPDRLNMIGVTVAIGLLLHEKKISHPLMLLLLFYLSIKSGPFIYNIFTYGDGFAG